ncbi:hypothetical protein [Streptomyces sp. B1I3]|uniref:hypothetical protein n=1 Tax=Streptomyces sp. B1I3 TaxID=3042264 RepID=UPI00278397CD|nr:hypothetical protein [Streptomyces sp. B1I3]MDQ0792604.1 hypothetical protein [Streptomyces sp. B1I3]
MIPARPSRTPAPAPFASRPRLSRVAALAAGATLGLGALAVPLTATGPAGADATEAVALVADTVAPAVTLGTTSVKAGGEVTFQVSGFPAGTKLAVKFDDTTVLLRDLPIGDDGSASGRVTVPADAAPGGEHWLRFLAPQTSVRSENLSVTGTTSTPGPTPAPTAKPTPTPTPTATAPAATPKVRLAGSEVAAGGKVTFALSGFTRGQSVTVKLDDTGIIGQWPSAVKADGTLTATVTVPKSTAAGAHWLRFLAPAPSTSLKADISVTPSGTGGGDTGPSAGGTSGGGDTSGSGGSSGTGGSGTGGSSTGSSGTGGSGTGGSGSGTGAASATITAGSQVAAGGRVSFRVTGFPAGQQLTVKLDDSKIIGQWPGIGADGSFSGSVTVPADATAGAHWLRFLAPNPSTSLRADFTVTTGAAADAGATTGGRATGGSDAPVPAASGAPAAASNSRGAKAEVTADQVQAGGKIHFKVTKFPAGRTVTVKFDDEEILGQWKADAAGAYEGDVTIPAETQAGAHWLRFLAPNPSTTLKVGITVSAPGTAAVVDGAQAAASTAPRIATDTTATAASVSSPVSYATIGWSAAAAAVGGAAGAAGTTLFAVRRRTGPAAQA